MNLYTLDSLNNPAIWHGITAREAGNLARHTGDDPDRVTLNRAKLAERFGVSPDRFVWMNQIHGSTVMKVDSPPPSPLSCDAIITDQPGIMLAVMVADCVPILFWDPISRAVGVAHAGWRGTLSQIASETIRAMQKEYGSDPANVRAGIGPAILGRCYEVDKAVADPWRAQLGEKHLTAHGSDHWLLDLQAANRAQLLNAGLRAENIQTMAICTHCEEAFFSYRRGCEKGRFVGVIGLKA